VGDIEGAISALERLLLIDANQPEVKLELGVLYYRLGSKEAALTSLEGALLAAGARPG
jgi:Flp pilus assembly protein TadD